ncbi:MAG: FIST N-terminal domain-containing protein, partial [Planctomycetota bacterium]
MPRFGTGLSTHPDSAQAAREAALRAHEAAGGPATIELALLLLTEAHQDGATAALAATQRTLATDAVAGAVGRGVLTEGGVCVGMPAAAVLVASGTALRAEAALLPDAASEDLGQAVGLLATRQLEEGVDPVSGILFPSPLGFRSQEFSRAVHRYGPALRITGAAPDARRGTPTALAAGKVSRHRSALLLLQGAEILGRSCVLPTARPIGRPAVVTAGEGRVIRSLAGRQAVTVLGEALEAAGLPDWIDTRTGTERLFLGWAPDPTKHPLGVGDYAMRSMTAIDTSTGAIEVSDRIRRGQTVCFHLLDPEVAERELGGRLEPFAADVAG